LPCYLFPWSAIFGLPCTGCSLQIVQIAQDASWTNLNERSKTILLSGIASFGSLKMTKFASAGMLFTKNIEFSGDFSRNRAGDDVI